MRHALKVLRARMALLPIRWLPILTWGVLLVLIIAEQWTAEHRVDLQKTLDSKVSALQRQQRQVAELQQLEAGLAPYRMQRHEGELEERVRRLAMLQGLQLQSLEQSEANPSQRRSTTRSNENRMVLRGSLQQIDATLQQLAAQLDPVHTLSLRLQTPSEMSDGRRLQLELSIQTHAESAPAQPTPAFWQWLNTTPQQTTLGSQNPFQALQASVASNAIDGGSPLNELELNALLLVGTLTDTARGQSRALFLLPDNRVVSARIGDAIGRERARILAINADAVDVVVYRRDSTTSSSLQREHQRLSVHSAPIGSAP